VEYIWLLYISSTEILHRKFITDCKKKFIKRNKEKCENVLYIYIYCSPPIEFGPGVNSSIPAPSRTQLWGIEP
jgi:hypothetical protein